MRLNVACYYRQERIPGRQKEQPLMPRLLTLYGLIGFFIFRSAPFLSLPFFFIFQREERSLLIGFVGKNVRARGNVIVDGRVFNGKVLAKSDLILLQ